MPMQDAKDGIAPGSSGLVERYVTTAIKVESLTARAMYWGGALVSLAIFGFGLLALNQVVQTGNWRGLVAVLIVFAVAALIYFLGWGWRWLWSGRTDNFFGRKKYSAPGRLDEARQKVATALSFWVW
jgi:uncharacterized membrane protein YcjF (UPF0283 family)